jgi:hypothetical protein
MKKGFTVSLWAFARIRSGETVALTVVFYRQIRMASHSYISGCRDRSLSLDSLDSLNSLNSLDDWFKLSVETSA